MKILLIEDDTYFPIAFIEMMNNKGHEVIHFEDGLEAYEHFIKDKSYDVIVCDYKLPRMNGDEIVKEIRKFSDVPVVACSNMYNGEMMQAGANDCMNEKRIMYTSYPTAEDWEITLKGVLK